MRSRLALIAVLAGACVAAASAVGAPAAGATALACGKISGAGSSLQLLAQQVWIHLFTTLGDWKPFCTKEPEVEYHATSSGKGMEQWGSESATLGTESPFPAFIGTDVGPEEGQIEHIDLAGKEGTTLNGVTAVPVAQSAVSVLVTLPGSCFEATGAAKPRVTEKALEEEWFAHTLTAETLFTNAKIKGGSCALVPNLYARFSASGTTAGFKRWLSDLPSIHQTAWENATETAVKSENNEWAAGGAKPLEEEQGEKLEKGSQLAKAVYEKPLSAAIGYADLADAVKAGFSTTVTLHFVGSTLYDSFLAEVQNNLYTSATPEYASPENTSESNCSGAEYKLASPSNEVAPNINWSNTRQLNVIKESASVKNYPICTLTFDLAWRNYEFLKTHYTNDEETANSVRGYLTSILGEGQTTPSLKTEHYGPLSPALDTLALAGVNTTNIKP
jgi:hypothetical protein